MAPEAVRTFRTNGLTPPPYNHPLVPRTHHPDRTTPTKSPHHDATSPKLARVRSDADRGRRNLRQDAVGIITLIEPWACGEQPVPGATATSPVNRPWPTAYPDSD